jgi:alpha-acetolactate decarboxylase
MGLGTLLAPSDPLVIVDGSCYRLDATMAVSGVSPLERVHCAKVVDFRDGSRSRIEHPVPDADVARLATQVLGALPGLVAVRLSGTFSRVAVPQGTFGRTDGVAVGFVRSTSAGPDRHLSFVTADRTFGGAIRKISIDNVELTVVAPRVVYLAGTAEHASASPGAALPRLRSDGS